MAKSEFTIDLSEFEKLFNRATVQLVPQAAERGLGQAGLLLLGHTGTEDPVIPKDEGTLAGSWSLFVQNKLKKAGPNDAATDHKEPIGKDEMMAVVGFNSPYAVYQHEGQRKDGSHVVHNYTLAGSGPDFLKKPLSDNREFYMKKVADEIKKALGN